MTTTDDDGIAGIGRRPLSVRDLSVLTGLAALLLAALGYTVVSPGRAIAENGRRVTALEKWRDTANVSSRVMNYIVCTEYQAAHSPATTPALVSQHCARAIAAMENP